MNTLLLAIAIAGQCVNGRCSPAQYLPSERVATVPVSRGISGLGWQGGALPVATASYAAVPVPEWRRLTRFTVEVNTRNGNGFQYGSGTIVKALDNRALVLTVAHGIDADSAIEVIHDSSSYAGRLVARANNADLAAVEIAVPPDIAALARSDGARPGQLWEVVVANAPAPGIVMTGFGGKGSGRRPLMAKSGRFLGNGVRSCEVAYQIQPWLGDSGGAVWNAQSEFAGVLAARDGDNLQQVTEGYVVSPVACQAFLSARPCCFGFLFGGGGSGGISRNRFFSPGRDIYYGGQPASPFLSPGFAALPYQQERIVFQQSVAPSPPVLFQQASPQIIEAQAAYVPAPQVQFVVLPIILLNAAQQAPQYAVPQSVPVVPSPQIPVK